MDNNETIVTATGAVIGSKSAFGGSLVFSSMVVFNDPAYIIIGVIGAILSVMSEHYDVSELRRKAKRSGEEFDYPVISNLIKAFIIGLLFTIASFIFLNQVGEALIKHYIGVGILVEILPSFWMVATLWMATKSIALYDRFFNKVGI